MGIYLARRSTKRSRHPSFTGAILNSNSEKYWGETERRQSYYEQDCRYQ